MIRRLNFTGRRKIPRSRISFRLEHDADGSYLFTADYDLRKLGFADDAQVFVEAYNAVSYMRFDFGTVAARRDPPDTRLREVTPRPMPRFRLKVVDRRERAGLLLGVADQILPLRPQEGPDQRQPLLPVDFCDLGNKVWRLDLSDWPVLELNHRIDAIADDARSGDAFLSLVYPARHRHRRRPGRPGLRRHRVDQPVAALRVRVTGNEPATRWHVRARP